MKNLFVIFLIYCSCTLISQECDSLYFRTEYEELVEILHEINPQKGLVFSDSLINIIETQGLQNCEIYYWILFRKGQSYELLFELEQPLEYYYQILDYAKLNGRKFLEAETYLSIARIHEFLGRSLDCKRNLEEAREIILENEFWGSFSRYAVRYSSFHRLFESRDTARYYAKLAVDYGKRYGRYRSELDGSLLRGILEKDIDAKIDFFRKAIDLFLLKNAFYGAASQKLNIAKTLFRVKRVDEALAEVNGVLDYINNYIEDYKGADHLRYSSYDLKREIYHLKGNLDSSYHYSELSHDYHIRSNKFTDQQKISQIEIENAINQGKFELEELRKRTELFQWLLVIGIIIFSIIIIMYFINIRNKAKIDKQRRLIQQKNEELEVTLKEHATLLSEVHHRVKNNLQMIISLLTLQGEKSDNIITKKQLQNLSNKIRSIALIHDQLYQKGEFDSINMEDYCNDLFTHFTSLFNDASKFNFEVDCPNITLNLETVIPLGIILSELITNSFKYANPESAILTINLKVIENDNKFTLTYKDNGQGYVSDKLQSNESSMGSLLIFSMARQLMAKINTYNSGGAIFEIEFKQKKVSTI